MRRGRLPEGAVVVIVRGRPTLIVDDRGGAVHIRDLLAPDSTRRNGDAMAAQ